MLWFFSICRYRYLSHMCGTCVKGYSPLCLFKNQKEREREKKKSVFFFISCIYRVFFFSCLLHEGLHWFVSCSSGRHYPDMGPIFPLIPTEGLPTQWWNFEGMTNWKLIGRLCAEPPVFLSGSGSSWKPGGAPHLARGTRGGRVFLNGRGYEKKYLGGMLLYIYFFFCLPWFWTPS